MKKSFFITLFALSSLLPLHAHSATPTEDLSTCLVDTLNGKERKELMKWIFFAMASHPEISPFSKVNSDDRESSDKLMGDLVTRLLTEDCPDEMKLAHASNPLAIEKAFEVVGQVAMQELMTNQQVNQSIANYSQYADTNKITSILTE